jgi:hypothetical protein
MLPPAKYRSVTASLTSADIAEPSKDSMTRLRTKNQMRFTSAVHSFLLIFGGEIGTKYTQKLIESVEGHPVPSLPEPGRCMKDMMFPIEAFCLRWLANEHVQFGLKRKFVNDNLCSLRFRLLSGNIVRQEDIFLIFHRLPSLRPLALSDRIATFYRSLH